MYNIHASVFLFFCLFFFVGGGCIGATAYSPGLRVVWPASGLQFNLEDLLAPTMDEVLLFYFFF